MSSCISCIYKSLGIVYPFVDVGINIDLSINNPRGSYVVGVYAVCIIDRRNNLISLVLQFLGRCYKCIPISELGLNVFRSIRAEHFLSSFTVIDHDAGAALP